MSHNLLQLLLYGMVQEETYVIIVLTDLVNNVQSQREQAVNVASAPICHWQFTESWVMVMCHLL